MTDTKELRRLAQEALIGPDGVSMRWLKLLKDFQEEANPSEVLEILDRLEAWENVFGHLGTPDEVGNEWLALTDRLKKVEAANKEWLEKTEWVQAEINNWTLPMRHLGQHRADVIRAEVDALRARIEAMERLEQIEAAAQNLVKVKGRYNTEIAYQRLVAALEKSK